MKNILIAICLVATASSFAQNYQDHGKLVATDRKALTELGASVDISGDYAVVGSIKEYMTELGTDSLVNAGAVYVFERQSNNSWVEVQKLVNSDREEHDNFGVDIAIDGTTLIVGAPGQDFDENGVNFIPASGAAYIYDRQASGQWTLSQKIVCNTRQITAQIGKIVDISGDWMLMGSYNDYTDENYANSLSNAGAIYMFQKNLAGTWVEMEKIVASDRNEHEWFAIESHLNNNRLIVGAHGVNHPGKAYVFELNSTTGWGEQQILSTVDVVAGDDYGLSVSINDTYAVVGAQDESEDEQGLNSINDAGAIYIYALNQISGMYDSLQKIAMPDRIAHGSFAYFGRDLEITNDNQLFVGAFSSSYSESHSGAAYNFDVDTSGLFVFDEKFGALDGTQSDMVGERIAVSGKHIILSTRANDTDANGANMLTDGGGAFIVKSCKTVSEITVDECESYLLPSGSSLITSSGTYSDLIQNSEGCDSALTINVTIHPLPVNTITQIDAVTIQTDDVTATSTYQWLDCDDNYTAIPSETGNQLVATMNGNYAVEVTTGFGCVDTSQCIEITSVGVDEIHADPLVVYPNPSNGTIAINGIGINSKLTILDAQGREVFRKFGNKSSELSMNLSLARGYYLVQVERESGEVQNVRLIIK